jgi:hypothetical protein
MEQIVLYPNPVLDRFFISGIESRTSYHLMDILGREVLSGTTSGSVDVSSLKAGLYTVVVTGSQELVSRRFLKL